MKNYSTTQSQITDENCVLYKQKTQIHTFAKDIRPVDKHDITNHTGSNSDVHQSQAHTLPGQPSLVTGARADKFGLSFWGPEIPACLHTTECKGRGGAQSKGTEGQKGKKEKGGSAEGEEGGATEAGKRNGERKRKKAGKHNFFSFLSHWCLTLFAGRW